jgi:hypothetical protein
LTATVSLCHFPSILQTLAHNHRLLTKAPHALQPGWRCTLQVQSTLTDVELPFGESFVTDMKTVERAKKEDLNKTMTYRLAFACNAQGRVILDRRFNTAAILASYYGSFDAILRSVTWDSTDPSDISVRLPSGGGMQVRS